MDIVLVLTLAGVAGLIGGVVGVIGFPAETQAAECRGWRHQAWPPRPRQHSGGGTAVEGHIPRPGFVPFLEVPLEAGRWLILGDAGVILATQGTDERCSRTGTRTGDLCAKIEVGEDRVVAGFQNIQIWTTEKGFAARGTLSLHMIVDIPTTAIARFGWQVLPYQPKGHLEAGSSLTAVPIDELKRHPESLLTDDYLAHLANRPDMGGFPGTPPE